MIKEITTYIANNVALTLETDLFAGFRPESAPDTCVAIIETTGGPVDSYFPDTGSKYIQVLSRAESYWTARSNNYLVHDFLKSKAQVTLPVVSGGPTYIAEFIEAINFPQSVGQNENDLWEFSSNYIFRICKQT